MRPLLPLWRDDVEAHAVGSRGSLLWWLWWHYSDKVALDWSWYWPWRWVCRWVAKEHSNDGYGMCAVCGTVIR